MEVIECPHCHRKVLPHEDGRCPACREDTRLGPNTLVDRTRLDLGESTRLPPICCSCAEPTDHRVKVRETVDSRASEASVGGSVARATVGLLFGVIGSLLVSGEDEGGDSIPIDLKVPRCKACCREGELRAEGVDPMQLKVTLIVHREFARQVEELENGA